MPPLRSCKRVCVHMRRHECVFSSGLTAVLFSHFSLSHTLPVHSPWLQKRAEHAAHRLQVKGLIRSSPLKRKVENAVADALKSSGTEVQRNAIVAENSMIVGLLMGGSSVKRGVPIEILDQV